MNSSIPPVESCSMASVVSRSWRTVCQAADSSPGTARARSRQDSLTN